MGLWLGGLVKYGLDSDPPGKRISLRRSLIGALEDLKRSCDQRNSKVQPSERLVHRRFHVPGRGTVTLDRDKRVRRPLRRLHRHLRSCYGDGELCSQRSSFLQPELSRFLRCPAADFGHFAPISDLLLTQMVILVCSTVPLCHTMVPERRFRSFATQEQASLLSQVSLPHSPFCTPCFAQEELLVCFDGCYDTSTWSAHHTLTPWTSRRRENAIAAALDDV